MKIQLTFDGGSRGNPGSAYGSFWAKSEAWKRPILRRLDLGHGTNNEAEYRTLIGALEELLKDDSLEPSQAWLEIRTDSALVVGQLSQGWKVKSKTLKPLLEQARRLLKAFDRVEFVHTPRSEIRAILGH